MDVGDRNQEATCYVGDLDSQVTEALLWELCVQVGAACTVIHRAAPCAQVPTLVHARATHPHSRARFRGSVGPSSMSTFPRTS